MRACKKTTQLFLLLVLIDNTTACTWPSVDALFILDSSVNVAQFEHMDEVDFVKKSVELMKISDTKGKLALAQYTPTADYVFSLEDVHSTEETTQRLMSVPYKPCDIFATRNNCTPIASVNSIGKFYLPIGNRKWLPDVIVVIANGQNSIPEITEKEVLLSPISPIHAFRITISGSNSQDQHFEPSATSIRMGAIDFKALQKLVDPLCESVNQFVGGSEVSVFGPLCWIVTSILTAVLLILICISCYAVYSYRDEANRLRRQLLQSEKALRNQNEYFTAKLHSQMEDQIRAGQRHTEEILKQQETLKNLQTPQPSQILIPYNPHDHRPLPDGVTRRVNKGDEKSEPNQQPLDLFPMDPVHWQTSEGRHGRRDEHQRTEFHGKHRHHSDEGDFSRSRERERHSKPRHNSDRSYDRPRRRRRRNSRSSSGSSHSSDARHLTERNDHHEHGNHSPTKGAHDHSNGGGIASDERLNDRKIEVNDTAENRKHKEHNDQQADHNGGETHRNKDKGEDEPAHKNLQYEESTTDSTDDGSETLPSVNVFHGNLPVNHPARSLPPVDILFLVDSSSSIGISVFEAMKLNISNLLDDIDIAPGRSRVALIQYALEPSVVFGFDKYYSAASVKKGIARMSYTGGATMLAKALSFAAGILYKEQNLKELRKTHKLMPTPRHDRPQILCVVSDGASDDNVDKSSNWIHDKLQIKVLALVSKSFNRDKLLPVTRFDGSIFVITQKESISIWIWRQQKLWAENYTSFLERLKSVPLTTKEKRSVQRR